MLRGIAWMTAILAGLIYRNGPSIRNNILFPSSFPVGYYAGGPYHLQCTTISDPSGALTHCEDASFWDLHDESGTVHERRVLLACDPGRKAWNTVLGPLRDPAPHGALWVYTPGAARAQRIAIAGFPAGHDFHPLGMEAAPSHAGRASSLFVINHARARTVIEQLVLSPADPPRATWVRTLTSPYFVAPNALALTGPTSFYVTNDHLLTRRMPVLGHVLPLMETVLALPLGWVSHVSVNADPTDPTLNHTFAALGIPFANGIALSPSGDTLAVSSTSLGSVFMYARDPRTNKLQKTGSVPVPFSPDNLSFDADGTLIAAGHPHFPALIKVAANATGATSPSWVVAISPRKMSEELRVDYDQQAPTSASSKVPPSRTHTVETLFQSDGTGFGMSTTGLRDTLTGNLYVPGLYEDGLLVCKP